MHGSFLEVLSFSQTGGGMGWQPTDPFSTPATPQHPKDAVLCVSTLYTKNDVLCEVPLVSALKLFRI